MEGEPKSRGWFYEHTGWIAIGILLFGVIVYLALGGASNTATSDSSSSDTESISSQPGKAEDVQDGAHSLAHDVCQAAGWRRVAAEYGGTDPGSAAEAYADESAIPEARSAAVEGCLAGFGE